MCQILLVDDELLTIQAVEMNIDWERCGITRVFLCDNVPEAKQILEKEEIALVVSDIEMPGEDGIAFVSWIRRKKPWLPVFFLTGYAEFSYAKAAVSLQAEDYILKPVDYRELEKKLQAAVEKVRLRLQEGRLKQQYSIHRDELYGEWVRFLLGTETEPAGEELLHHLERFHLDFTADSLYVLVRLRLHGGVETSWERLQQMKREMVEGLSDTGARVYASNFQEEHLDLCVRLQEAEAGCIGQMRERLAALVVGWEQPCCCFVSEPVRVEQIIPMTRKLAERDGRNVLYQNKLVLVGLRNIFVDEEKLSIDDRRWREMLENREFGQLSFAIDFYLQGLVASGRISRESLHTLCNWFLQLMYHYIGENFSQREKLLRDEQIGRLQKKALNSVEDFRQFMHLFLERTQETLLLADEPGPVAEVRKYIDEHLTEHISRTKVAEHVALNENYLSRLFRQEIGCSISDYIQEKRIALAKRLLLQTDLSVSEVGVRVGYDTTAYFIRLFKREVGKTPKEYRKDMKL